MNEKQFNIPGVVRCKLEYLTDPKLLTRVENYQDVLRAVCKAENRITHEQAWRYLTQEQIEIILDELRAMAQENAGFYKHFEIDYNKHKIGPTIGSRGNNPVFWLRPQIEIKPLQYSNLNERTKKAAQLFITNRMFNEGVPFEKEENVNDLLNFWNPTIEFKNGLMKCFSQRDSKKIDLMVRDRLNHRKSK